MPQTANWSTYIAVASADATAAKVLEAGGSVLTEPFVVITSGRMAVVSEPEGAGALSLAGERALRRTGRQRTRRRELQRPQHARRRERQSLLRRGLRVDDADHRGGH